MRVIAEAGVNWCGMKEAYKMIKQSKETGCWAVKFQVYNESNIIGNENAEFLKSIMIDRTKARSLLNYSKSIGQKLFFTPMYPKAIDWLEDLGVDYYKVRYFDRYNEKLLRRIRRADKLTFISVSIFDISCHDFTYWDDRRLFPLYCIPSYPAKFNDYGAICSGMSDHTGDTKLLQLCMNSTIYHEIHVKLYDGCLENDWSVSFEQLKEVLK